MVRPMVHSTKHYVQISISSVATVAKVTEELVNAVAVNQVTDSDEVAEGSTVKAIYVELSVLGQTATQNFIMCICKVPGSGAGPTFANMVALFDYPNKKNIFYTTQGLAPNDGVGQPVTIVRGWIKVPKSKQRFGLGDRILLVLANQGDGSVDYCGFATYKEYT